MNTINFIQTGGVPLTNNVAAEFERAYSIFNAYGAMAGDKTIISGCVKNGTAVSDGFVYVKGELFYFEGGNESENVFLNVENVDKVFEDQTTKTLIKIRSIKFGNATENVWAWSEFKRIDTMLSLMLRLDTLEASQTITNAKLAIFTQGGVVFPWFKSVGDIPEGFAPVWNIAGKTIVGLDPNDTDFDTVGKLFGSKTHQLTVEELPRHRHGTTGNTAPNDSGIGNFANGSGSEINTKLYTDYEGLDYPHNNVQPSIVANYIEWVGLD